ncbi:MAG: DUF3300 domain-containing protein [Thermoanaerobaculaceae bacterium]|jgi:hypothetical protein|nr:DUF3300 domain-containing protein [Thermoanaerobaculaceae bacterium]
MKTIRFHLIPLLACSMLAVGLPLGAQGRAYSPDEVTQMVAPIALYPDALLSQVLMAATYPAQVTETELWVRANPGLTGSALDDALATATWDPSVIALAKFPTVLDRMAQDITWTTDLGIAFLFQRTDVMDAVQDLRRAAYENGSLTTTTHGRVVVEGRSIVIQPFTSEVIYVPVYQPSVVYGSYWHYPSTYYPNVWAPWPGYSFVRGFAWGLGYHLGSILFGGCDWGHHDVWMDYRVLHGHSMYHSASHHRHGCGGGDCGRRRWDHHSGGVGYHNGGTGAPYGGRSNDRVNGIERATLRANRSEVGSINTRTAQRGQTDHTARDLSRTTQHDARGNSTRNTSRIDQRETPDTMTRHGARTTQRDLAATTTRTSGRPTVNGSATSSARGAGRVTMNSSTSSTTRGASRQTTGRSTDHSTRNASRLSVGGPSNPTARGGDRPSAHGPTGYTGNRSVQRGQTGITARDSTRPTAHSPSRYSAGGATRPSGSSSSNSSGRSYNRPSASGPSGSGRPGSSHSSARPSGPGGRASAPGASSSGGRGASAPRGGGAGRGHR